MTNDHTDTLYDFAEKAFIRIQAGEVLSRCLDVENISPIHHLVESLVLAGPDSLDVLREVLAETSQRKQQVQTDLQQVMSGLRSSLASYGFHLPEIHKASSLNRLRPSRMATMLRVQGVTDEETQHNCMQLMRDARDLVKSLGDNYNLLAQAERYLEDWMLGVCYLQARQATRLH